MTVIYSSFWGTKPVTIHAQNWQHALDLAWGFYRIKRFWVVTDEIAKDVVGF